MKKVCIALIFICALFAILFELIGTDPDHAFTFRAYFKYVTENIKPFPTVDFNGDLLSDMWQVFSYIFRVIDCVLQNVLVLLQGLFPIDWKNPIFGGMTEEEQEAWYQKWLNNLLGAGGN